MYSGYSKRSSSYELGVENSYAYGKGKYSYFQANGDAMFTEYLRGSAYAKAGYAEGDVKLGFSDKYKGFSIGGEVGGVDTKGVIVLGSENFNGSVELGAKALSADGKVDFEFEEDGQFALGVDSSVTGAEAYYNIGINFLSYSYKDSPSGETEQLFGAKVGVDVGVGGDFALHTESKTAIETDIININATTVKIKAQLFVGAEIKVTVPTPYLKWPW